MNNLTLGSLFDGSGGFPLGGLISGITPVWASEIEPFPIRVTSKRMPFMKHYGDISAMDGAKVEPVDIITFGSPCQDMSVAGKRDGLDGERSSLFYEAVRIIKEMRCATDGKYPRWICWENVPGAFSSNSGRDFKAVLEAVIGVVEPGIEVPMPEKNRWPYADCYMGDGWSLAYRTLDAQYWGVAQRRRRIYLVADFGGRSAGEILFKSEGLSGYSPQSFRAWERIARCPQACAGATGGSVGLIDSVGGQAESYELADKSHTLKACHYKFPPCVTEAAGFCTEESAKTRGIGFEEERSPTLRAGVVPAAVFRNHGQGTDFDGPVDIAPTVCATYGMGGNNQPFVVNEGKPVTLKVRCGCEGGGKGALMQTDKSATLACNNDQAVFVPACSWTGDQVSPTLTRSNAGGSQRMPDKENFNCVIQAVQDKTGALLASGYAKLGTQEAQNGMYVIQPFGICSDKSNAMLSDNPHSGIYEAETSRTLDANGGNPGCNQGGIAIVALEGNGSRPSHRGDGYRETEQMYTLNATEHHSVAYGIGRDAFNQGKNAQYKPAITEEVQPTLIAKGPGAAMQGYTVRRLTPTECARLQGFPDWWCSELEIPEPTTDEVRYWYGVFETHRRITGSSAKPKSLKQIIKWLKAPNSDSAEYKMWGNGVALPCVIFVLSGIVWYAQSEGT